MPPKRRPDEVPQQPPVQSLLPLLEESIPKFTGTDKTHSITKWAQDIEDNAEIFGLSPIQTLLVARRSLSGAAALWLKTEKPFATYDNLKNALIKEYPDVVNVKEIHELMAKRTLQKGETCYEYMLHMKELGKRGRLPDYVAIQYIIDGISDYEPNKMILYGATTYPELKEKLKIYENIKKKSQDNRSEIQKSDIDKTDKVFVRKTSRCYNCGEDDHASNNCPHRSRGLKCFRCNQFGHIGANCTASSVATSKAGNFNVSRNVGNTATPTSNQSMYVKLVPLQDGGSDNEGQSESGHCQHCQNQDGDEVSNVLYADSVNKQLNKVKKPITPIVLEEKPANALIDSGSDLNLMSVSCFNSLKSKNYDKDDVQFTGLGGTTVLSFGKWFGFVTIDGHSYETIMHIVPDDVIPYDVILGQELLKNVTYVGTSGTMTVKPNIYECMKEIQCCKNDEEYIRSPNICDKVLIPNIEDHPKDYTLTDKPVVTTKAAPHGSENDSLIPILSKGDKPVASRPRRLALKQQSEVKIETKTKIKKKREKNTYNMKKKKREKNTYNKKKKKREKNTYHMKPWAGQPYDEE